MEEVVLRFFLPREELDIIHNQDIHTSIETGKVAYAITLDCVDEFHRELLAGNVDNALGLSM